MSSDIKNTKSAIGDNDIDLDQCELIEENNLLQNILAEHRLRHKLDNHHDELEDEYHYEEQNDVPPDNDSLSDEPDETPQPTGPKKRGIPKSILANQMKYMEALEKQQRMTGKAKKGKTNAPKEKPQISLEPMNTDGMKRMIEW